MIISDWEAMYSEILREFNYSKEKDNKSAVILNSILRKSNTYKKINKLIKGKTVFVIGSGPSL